jgi:hypothetical protein
LFAFVSACLGDETRLSVPNRDGAIGFSCSLFVKWDCCFVSALPRFLVLCAFSSRFLCCFHRRCCVLTWRAKKVSLSLEISRKMAKGKTSGGPKGGAARERQGGVKGRDPSPCSSRRREADCEYVIV